MVKKIVFCIFLLWILPCLQSFAQGNAMSCSEIESWQEHPKYTFFKTLKGKETYNDVFVLKTRGNSKGVLVRSYPLFHYEKDSIIVDVNIKYKTTNCESFVLKFNSIGEKTEIIGIDSIMLPLSSEWLEQTYSLKVKTGFILEASLEAKGKDESQTGDLYLADLEISSEGKPLDYNIAEWSHNSIQDDCFKEWSELLCSPILSKRILGIGETIHGTQTLNDIGFELIKERILNHDCKIVALEVPVSMGLIFNRYVKNDSHFPFDLIKELTGSLLFNPLEMLQWIKEYNKNHDNHISVIGVDREYSFYEGSMLLYSFLNRINTDGVLDSFIYDVMFDNAINPTVLSTQCHLPQMELKLLLCSINDIKGKDSSYFRLPGRDKNMAEITQLLCDAFLASTETATFYGHFLHTNYLSASHMSLTNSIPSMGKYLREKYGEDYSCLALSAFKGSSWFRTDEHKTKLFTLSEATKPSLEYYLNNQQSAMFLNMNDVSNHDVYSLRILGATFNAYQFQYLIPKERMDGVLSIKYVMPIKSEYIIDSTPDSKSKQYIEILKKINKKR